MRREQLKKLWDKYSIYVVALAILIVAGVGGWRGYQYLEAKKAAEAGAAFDRAVELSDQNKHAEAEAAFADLAAKAFDDIAADTSVAASERDLARVRAAQLLLETATYPNMLQRLETAAGKDGAFRHSARELLALSAWKANDATAARQWLDMIANDGETPPGLRSRAEALQALLPPVAKS